MANEIAKLKAFMEAQRPAMLAALGLQPDDKIALEVLWQQFAQKAMEGGSVKNVLAVPPENPLTDLAYFFTKEWAVPLENPVAGETYYARPLDKPLQSIADALPQFSWANTLNGISTLLGTQTVDELVSTVNDAVGADWLLENGGDTHVTLVQFEGDRLQAALYFHEAATINGVEHSGWRAFNQAESATTIDPIEDHLNDYMGDWVIAQDVIDSGLASALFELVKPAGVYAYTPLDDEAAEPEWLPLSSQLDTNLVARVTALEDALIALGEVATEQLAGEDPEEQEEPEPEE